MAENEDYYGEYLTRVDVEDRGLNSNQKVWDPGTLSWKRMGADISIEIGTVMVPELTDGTQKTKIITSLGVVVDTFGADPVGLKDAGDARINPAKEDGNLNSVKTAVEIIDNFISGTRGLVTEDNSSAIKTAVELIDNFISGSRGLVTEDSASAIKTAVEIIDNFISGSRGLVTEDNSANIKLNTDYPVGSGDNSSVTLTNANTAYAVPSTASTKRHILVLYNGSDTDMYWGYENSNANGILLPSGGKVTMDLGASQEVYAYCASAAKVITYTYKEVN